jgi:hypothetical protein
MPLLRKTPHESRRLQQRDTAMQALIQRGGASAGEILDADFCARGLPGLEARDWPDRPFVTIQSMLDSARAQQGGYFRRKRDLARAGGFVSRGENTIYINPQYLDPRPAPGYTVDTEKLRRITSDLISHELIHILQQSRGPARGIMTFSNGHTRPLMHAAYGKGENDKPGIWRRLRRGWLNFQARRYYKFTIPDYFAEEAEIQARLHQLIVHAAAGWDRLPANRGELFAALFNMGFKMPPAIRKKRLRGTKPGKKALKAFRTSKRMRANNATTIQHLNLVYDWLGTDANRHMLFDHAYPGIYADLLTLYGVTDAGQRLKVESP